MDPEKFKSFKEFRKQCEHFGCWVPTCHHPKRYNGNNIEDCICFKEADCPELKENKNEKVNN
jgi:hypothetical protein